MQAKKSLGQNFLTDPEILSAIADYGGLSPSDTVLEIGPGHGDLTRVLCQRAGRVVAVEFDRDLYVLLSRELAPNYPNLELIHGDILSFDLSKIPAGYKVVANIPYNITSPIIAKLLTTENSPTLAVLLVQKEVAERMAAQPGKLSASAVLAQAYAEITAGLIVPAKYFDPIPKVDSQVLIMRRRERPLVPLDRMTQFEAVVHAGFAQPRKKLKSSLAVGLKTNKEAAERLLNNANIDSNLRPQNLTINDWLRLTNVVARFAHF